MEALPRSPMLSFELKLSPEPVEFGKVLKQYIEKYYQEDPSSHNKACTDLEQLRYTAVQVSHDFMGCSQLKRYYSQLLLLEKRFPMGVGEEAAIPFTWEDIHVAREYIHSDIKFEQACILYNIGALHSVLGAMDSRQDADGMKVSCTHFQCASWAFNHLKDHYSSSAMSFDMSHDILMFQSELMLAQAQECILEKSMTDNRKSSITAKVAIQIVEYLRSAVRYLDAANKESLVNVRKYKLWRKRVEIKIVFYQLITDYYLGIQAEEQEKWGTCLAYFTCANDRLNECMKLAKNDVAEMQETLRFAMDVVGGKYTSAKKDNDFVYHEKLVPYDSLPDIKGASLVKGIPFDPFDPEVSGPDLFSKIVPITAHEAASLYSEEKAVLLRKIQSEVEQKQQELEEFKTALNVGELRLALSTESPPLPDILLEKCAAISARPDNITHLIDVMNDVSGLATDVDMTLAEVTQLLSDDAQAEAEYQTMFGKRTPNPSIEMMQKDITKFTEAHKMGSQSNKDLHVAMNNHVTNLRLLSGPLEDLNKELPGTLKDINPDDQAIFTEMTRLLDKLNEMDGQRAVLMDELREKIKNDDITQKLVGNAEHDNKAIFAAQLQKFDSTIGILRQNLAAQDKITRAITETNAKCADLRANHTHTSSARDMKVAELIMSYDKYEDLLAKSQKGREFYRKLAANVDRLETRIKGVLKAEMEERDIVRKKYMPKVPAPTRPSAPKPTGDTSLPTSPQPSFSSFDIEGPKLKDYLPFMKPATFGKMVPEKSSAKVPSYPTPSMSFSSGESQLDPVHDLSSLPPELRDVVAGYLPTPSSSQENATSLSHNPQMPVIPPGPKLDQSTVPPLVMRHALSSLPPELRNVVAGYMPTGAMPQFHDTTNSNQPNLTQQPHPTHQPVASQPNPTQQPVSNPTPQVNIRSIAQNSDAFPDLPTGYSFTEQPHVYDRHVQPNQMRLDNTNTVSSAHTRLATSTDQSAINKSANSSVFNQQMPYKNNQNIFNQSQIYPNSPTSVYHDIQQGKFPQYQQDVLPVTSYQSPQNLTYNLPNRYEMPQINMTMPNGSAGIYQNLSPQYTKPSAVAQLPMQPHMPQNTQMPNIQPNTPRNMRPQTNIQYGQASNLPAQQSHQPILGSSMQSIVQSPPQIAHYPNQPSHATMQPVPMIRNTNTPDAYPLPSQQLRGVQPQMILRNQQHSTMQQPYQQQPGIRQHYQQPRPNQQVLSTVQAQPHSLQHAMVPPMSVKQQSQVASISITSAQPSTSQQYHHQQQTTVQQQMNQQQMFDMRQNNLQHTFQQESTMQPSNLPQQPTSTGQQPHQHFQQQQIQSMQQPTHHPIQNQQMLPGQYPIQPPILQQYPSTGDPNHPQMPTGQYPNQALQTPSDLQLNQPTGQYPKQLIGPYPNTSTGSLSNQPNIKQHQIPIEQYPNQQPNQHHIPNQLQSNQQPSQHHISNQQQPNQQPSQHYIPNHQQPSQHYIPNHQQPNQQPIQQNQPYQQPMEHNISTTPPLKQLQPYLIPAQKPGSQLSSQENLSPVTGSYATTLANVGLYISSSPSPKPYLVQKNQQDFNQPVPSMTAFTAITHSYVPNTSTQEMPVLLPTRHTMSNINQPEIRDNAQQPVQQNVGQPTSQYKKPLPSQNITSAINPAIHSQINTPNVIQTPIVNEMATQINPLLPTILNPTKSETKEQNTKSSDTSIKDQKLNRETSNSLDEILAVDSETLKVKTSDGVLTPRVLTAQDIQLQKDEAMKQVAQHAIPKDPYSNEEFLEKFHHEVERYQKFVNNLSTQKLSGGSQLENIWKEIREKQERDSRSHSIVVARCYVLKNRDPDIMPYDDTRVLLSGADDYINASWLDDLSSWCPRFIACQAPLPMTITDFWSMVFEQGAEVIVMLSQQNEAPKMPIYWPIEKGAKVYHGDISITLQSMKSKELWIESILYICDTSMKQGRTVVHLQYLNWPISGLPDKTQSLIQFIHEVHAFYKQQRSVFKPVIVHCSNGVGRTGTFLTVYTGVLEIDHGNGIADIHTLVDKMRAKRKHMITDKEQLKFCYQALLDYSTTLLMQRGIILKGISFSEKTTEKVRHKKKSSDDIFQVNPLPFHAVQSTVNKFTIKQPSTGVGVVGESENMNDRNTVVQGVDQLIKPEPQVNMDLVHPTLPDIVPPNAISRQVNSVKSTQNVAGSVTKHISSDTSSSNYSNQPVAHGDISLTTQSYVIDIPTSASSQVYPQPGITAETPDNMSQRSSLSEPPTLPISASLGSSPHHNNLKNLHCSSLPQSLMDLQNPQMFTLESSTDKRRITKSSFGEQTSGLNSLSSDPDDPLSGLDPLWSMLKK